MTLTIAYSKEISVARAAGAPIVALESTIITHGMPFPQNVETARQVEDDIRRSGGVPATIAVIDGVLHVGLEEDELNRLASTERVAKLSRADLAVAMANGWTGATTVAATMIAAHAAGIAVFATGGIGGVHVGAEKSFDISADLQELAETPVIVVAAGAKAILDIPKTLEVLETLGVPVIAYGQDEFPAFWSRDSGLKAPLRLNDARAIAQSYHTRRALGLSGGHLIANPIPEDAEIPSSGLSPIIAAAQQKAGREDVCGKDVTPFLLQEIFDATRGQSLTANIALVRNNARLATAIAIELIATA